MNNKDLDIVINSLEKIEKKDNVIYFLIYDTKDNPRAAIKHIYDMALALKENEYNVKLITEDSTYSGVNNWLGDKYKEIETASLKDNEIKINVEDVLVIPEYYSNSLPKLSNIKAVKVMLIQQMEYMFETLSIGSRWSDFGFDKCITTTETSKNYIKEYFPEAFVHVNSPYIDDIYKPTEEPTKPFIAIHCRDKHQDRKIISQFYLKYPHLRWIAFRDMNDLTYEEFAAALKECMLSVWVDDDSTFGTFPLESMKCEVPVTGKIPNTRPDWLTDDNGLWITDSNEIVDVIGAYVLNWLEGSEITDDFKAKMKDTHQIYNKEVFESNTLSIFNSLLNGRINTLKEIINKNTNNTEE